MAYSKRFPRDRKASPFANWEEVALTKAEERAVEEKQRAANIELMRQCIRDARMIFSEEGLDDGVIDIAIALFTQRTRHVIYWKEERAKQKLNERPALDPPSGKGS